MNKLSIYNIGWSAENDLLVYELMNRYNFQGLEIAPTRIFPETPYKKKSEAIMWSRQLKNKYGFSVPSMQSIWYGRQEKIFGSIEERQILLDYTKKAIDFAVAIGCKNLVFGCPRNRNLTKQTDEKLAIDFFKELGDYAGDKGTVIGIEANPTIYNTNYINDTESALTLVEEVNSKGFQLNLDVGTMIQNGEKVCELIGKVNMINHVHISEPNLKPIKERKLHSELKELLEKENYNKFISIEMGRVDDITILEKEMDYIRRMFV